MPDLGDAAIAAGFAAVGVLICRTALERGLVAAMSLTVVHSGVLAWRRRAPEVVLSVQAVTVTIALLVPWPPVIFGPAVVATVHAVGVTRDRRRAAPVVVIALAVMAVAVMRGGATPDTVAGNAIVLIASWWLGDRQRQAVQRAEEVRVEADHRVERARADERLQIARELHDVVAHALSVIAVQAGTGRVVLDDDRETARQSLANIERESRLALNEMRRMLGVLRPDATGSADAVLAPAPGLADLEALLATTAYAGLHVDVQVVGERRPLPAAADLAAYRIIQEALTNVRRHASATRAEIRIEWTHDSIDIEVVDDGRGAGVMRGVRVARREQDGHGLVGMRERAEVFGGTFTAGDRPGGRGFRVAASLPIGAA